MQTIEYITRKNCGSVDTFMIWDHKPGNGDPVRRLAKGEVVPVRFIGDDKIYNDKKKEFKFNLKYLKYFITYLEPEKDNLWFKTPLEGYYYYNARTRAVFISELENKSDVNVSNLLKTFANIRDCINCNIRLGNAKHIVLTYATNNVIFNEKGMQDQKQLTRDFQKFWQRFKRYHIKTGKVVPEYINVVEPQARGVWHCHLVIFYPDKESNPYIDNEIIAYMWGNGFTKTKNIDNYKCDNFGVYFSAYLTDLDFNSLSKEQKARVPKEKIEWKKDLETGKPKRIVKGGRIWMYPAGMDIWRHSRGIKKPLVSEVTRGDVEFLTRNSKLKYKIDGQIINEKTGETVNTYRRLDYFNSKALLDYS